MSLAFDHLVCVLPAAATEGQAKDFGGYTLRLPLSKPIPCHNRKRARENLEESTSASPQLDRKICTVQDGMLGTKMLPK